MYTLFEVILLDCVEVSQIRVYTASVFLIESWVVNGEQ